MKTWTLEEARAELPRVAALVERIRTLVGLVRARGDTGTSIGNGHGSNGSAPAHEPPEAAELRRLLAELDRDGIVLRDPDRGLVDFPARSPSGREYLLCWLAGEEDLAWWHWPGDGFAGRTSLGEPPD